MPNKLAIGATGSEFGIVIVGHVTVSRGNERRDASAISFLPVAEKGT